MVSFRSASAGYFKAVGVPFLQGRPFADGGEVATRETVVNATFARRYLTPGEELGSRLSFDDLPGNGADATWYQVVGVVGDIRQTISQSEQPPEVFVPFEQAAWPLSSLVVRSEGAGPSLAVLRETIGSVDPTVVVDRIRPLTAELAAATDDSRTRALLVAAFALTALLLSAVGLYGVLASDVLQRTRELGIRLALGAAPTGIRRSVVRRGLGVVAVGLVLGLGGALLVARGLASRIEGLAGADPTSLLAAAAILLITAGVAGYLPARRAAQTDPAEVLRRD
jgi:hypothetical protein